MTSCVCFVSTSPSTGGRMRGVSVRQGWRCWRQHHMYSTHVPRTGSSSYRDVRCETQPDDTGLGRFEWEIPLHKGGRGVCMITDSVVTPVAAYSNTYMYAQCALPPRPASWCIHYCRKLRVFLRFTLSLWQWSTPLSSFSRLCCTFWCRRPLDICCTYKKMNNGRYGLTLP